MEIPILNDDLVEDIREFFYVRLMSDEQSATVAIDTLKINIRDNDRMSIIKCVD